MRTTSYLKQGVIVMRIENRVNDMPFKSSPAQNKNFEKALAENKNIQENKSVQKVDTGKNIKASGIKSERKDIVNPEVKTNEHFKIYTKDGSFKEFQLQEASELDVRV